MKIKLFQADFIEGEYKFFELPYDGSIPPSYRSNGLTYVPHEIPYHDTRFFIYSNHEPNDAELKKLEADWRKYCPQ